MMNDYINMEYVVELLEKFSAFGPIAGILLAMIEAFLPFLPLALFVTINVMAFGFLQGYLYSWIGSSVGSICVFFLIKKYGTRRFEKLERRNQRIANIFFWIKQKGFIPIFILLTFPFTPSIVVCGLAALSDIRSEEYIYATLLGKLIMVLSLSFIGYNVSAFIEKPIRSVALILSTLLISLIAKKVISLYERRIDRKRLEKMKESNDH